MARKKNGKKQVLKKLYILCMVLCLTVTGCRMAEENVTESSAEAAETAVLSVEITQARTESIETTESTTDCATQLSATQLDAYQQMTLYIQEGFRRYEVEGSYQAYFAPIEAGNIKCCDILLEGEDVLWHERIAYTYDEERDWYTFSGQYEPIFAKDTFWAESEMSSFVSDIRENYVYETQIAQDIDIVIPVHYYSETGPVERDTVLYSSYEENEVFYSVKPMLYTYYDDRMDVSITIEYLQISCDDSEFAATVNENLKKAFFYGYASDDAKQLLPQKKMYSEICRRYTVTREDERYLSLRIYENNYFRGANHPNEWETGITIDMQTGEVLSLKDVVGDGWSLQTLFDSGAFRCLWTWDVGEQEWLEMAKEAVKETSLSDYDSYFYLTEEGLGLITSVSRYYTCMEADYEELGLNELVK